MKKNKLHLAILLGLAFFTTGIANADETTQPKQDGSFGVQSISDSELEKLSGNSFGIPVTDGAKKQIAYAVGENFNGVSNEEQKLADELTQFKKQILSDDLNATLEKESKINAYLSVQKKYTQALQEKQRQIEILKKTKAEIEKKAEGQKEQSVDLPFGYTKDQVKEHSLANEVDSLRLENDFLKAGLNGKDVDLSKLKQGSTAKVATPVEVEPVLTTKEIPVSITSIYGISGNLWAEITVNGNQYVVKKGDKIDTLTVESIDKYGISLTNGQVKKFFNVGDKDQKFIYTIKEEPQPKPQVEEVKKENKKVLKPYNGFKS